MKLDNIHGFADIDEYIQYKLELYSKKAKNFESLFELMFDESDNVMIERSEGYRIYRTTYGEVKEQILKAIPAVAQTFSELPAGEIIGLYMNNSPAWLVMFWSILGAGYRPLLMNTRTADSIMKLIML